MKIWKESAQKRSKLFFKEFSFKKKKKSFFSKSILSSLRKEMIKKKIINKSLFFFFLFFCEQLVRNFRKGKIGSVATTVVFLPKSRLCKYKKKKKKKKRKEPVLYSNLIFVPTFGSYLFRKRNVWKLKKKTTENKKKKKKKL